MFSKQNLKFEAKSETNFDLFVRCYSTTIIDLPSEIIRGFILPHLSESDIKSFAKTGVKRFEEISNEYLKSNPCE